MANMMINLRKAEIEEAEEILKFYQNVIKSIEGTEFRTQWSERYPNLDYIKTAIENDEMHICKKHDEIIAGVVLNGRFDPEYKGINWNVNAKPDEITIIHTFAVSSKFSGKGIGKEVFRQIKNDAEKNGKTSIRLDIIDGNVCAQKVFEKFGFEYVDSVEMFHPVAGLETFHLYEFVKK